MYFWNGALLLWGEIYFQCVLYAFKLNSQYVMNYVVYPDIMYFKRNALTYYYSEFFFSFCIAHSILYLSWNHLETLINLVYWSRDVVSCQGELVMKSGNFKDICKMVLKVTETVFSPIPHQTVTKITSNFQNEEWSFQCRQEWRLKIRKCLCIFLFKKVCMSQCLSRSQFSGGVRGQCLWINSHQDPLP